MENVYCPVKGRITTLEQVPDAMFAKKMLGDGLAVVPEEDELFAPIDGTITVIYPTKHAIGITSEQGSELLIHIGLDTYDLKGTPFTMKVALGDHVKVGDPLLHVSFKDIIHRGYDTITPIISTNKEIRIINKECSMQAGEILFQIID